MKDRLYKIVHGILFLVFMDVIATGLWAWGVVHTFDEVVSKAPVAVVLINDFDDKTGELGEETLRRLDHALELYQEDTAGRILCVGGARPRIKVFGSQLMRDFLIEEGVPEEQVFLEKKSFDTKSNWTMTYETVKGFGWDHVIVVSSPFHLYRFRQITKTDPKKGLKVDYAPYSLETALPSISLIGIWKEVHYEWLAHFSQLLPRKLYKKWIREMRGQ